MPAAKTVPTYSFHLPTGGIRGAIANTGKVFFAPADGIDWVEADAGLKLKGGQVQARHIDLGKEGDKPRRTGAFVNRGHHVLFVTGKDAPNLVLLNANSAEPKSALLPLAVKKGTHATTHEVVTTVGGKAYAFVFHDRIRDADAEDVLEVVALDPNGDGDLADARSVKVPTVGKSAVGGTSGTTPSRSTPTASTGSSPTQVTAPSRSCHSRRWTSSPRHRRRHPDRARRPRR